MVRQPADLYIQTVPLKENEFAVEKPPWPADFNKSLKYVSFAVNRENFLFAIRNHFMGNKREVIDFRRVAGVSGLVEFN